MKTVKIGNTKNPFFADEANTRYVLEHGKFIDAGMLGIKSWASVEGRELVIDGRIEATDRAISFGAQGAPVSEVDISVGRSGRVLSNSYGVEVYGQDHGIENAGRIIGSSEGIHAIGDGLTITNSGRIEGHNYGIFLTVPEDGSAVVKNTGTITGNVVAAVQGSFGDEKFINSGTVVGNIQLSGGDDVFVFKSGRIDGEVRGGNSDDRYVIHKAGADIVEYFGEGFDLVQSSVSITLAQNIEQLNLIGRKDIDGTGTFYSNHIEGNAGDNTLSGLGGDDFLMGGKGRDILIGGDGGDFFNFQPRTGTDTVMDFEIGMDELQVGGLKGATDFADMMNEHAVQKGDDVWITYGQDTVILKGIDKLDLLAGDFNFG